MRIEGQTLCLAFTDQKENGLPPNQHPSVALPPPPIEGQTTCHGREPAAGWVLGFLVCKGSAGREDP